MNVASGFALVILALAMLTVADSTIGKDSGNAETLLLNININTQWLPKVVRAEILADGRLALTLATWHETQLRLPNSPLLLLPDNYQGYALESVHCLHYGLDRDKMLLTISAPASAFIGSRINQQKLLAALPDRIQPGFYLDYDASLSLGGERYESYGVLLEGVIFNSLGSVVSGLLVTSNHQYDHVLRTESYWRKDLPATMATLQLGDAISQGGAWSRPARYAGIRWARNFALRPGFISMPMPSLAGTAVLPSTIDVLINNQLKKTEPVNPGPFELINVPVMSGAGEINLIVRDLLGRESIINQHYYFSPILLAKGLSDFSVEAGFLRESFGVQNNAYDHDNGFLAFTRRVGLTSALTSEIHFEWQAKRQAVGVDIVALLGRLGTAEIAVATARADKVQGNHYMFAVERRTLKGNLALRWEHFDREFVQFAALPNESKPRQRLTISLGKLLPGKVSTAINYMGQTSWDKDRLNLLTLNLGVTLAQGSYLSAYASRDLGTTHNWHAGISINVALGKLGRANSSSHFGRNRNRVNQAELRQSTAGALGTDWRLNISDLPQQRWRGGFTKHTNLGRFSADASDMSKGSALRLGAAGAIGWLGGHTFATRAIGAGSFAVVKVGSIKDVPIYRSNQLIASTNSSGMALIPDLLPYQANQLTIDPVELPFDIEIQGVREIAVPFARSGLMVNFLIQRSRNALVLLRRVDGAVVPAGARVTVMPSEQRFIVGKRGEAYLMNLSDINYLSVQWHDGSCFLMLPLDPAKYIEPRIGPLICGEKP